MRGLFKLTKPEKPLGGRYKIIGELGAGGFGQTFMAEDLHLPGHPQCVVKQLKPQVSDASSLQTARRLFDIEAQVLYKLGNHDQIPRLLAHFEDNQEFYLAQELIEGEPLTHELRGQPWPEVRVIALLQDLLHVLAFVHQQQVIHRDIKPSNLIRRRRDGRIVLIDFGAVKQVSTQVVNRQSGQTKTISIGTQGYTPKEQLGGNPRFSSDIYATGIVGIHALTGIHPRRLHENTETGEIEWHQHITQVSPELVAILDCMVRYDFRMRYPTAKEAFAALRSLPTALRGSVPLPQQSSEGMQGLPPEGQSPSSATESSGYGIDVPTNAWVPTEPSAQNSNSAAPSGYGIDVPTNAWVPTEPSAQNSNSAAPSGYGVDVSTNAWVPTEPSAQNSNSAGSTGSRQPLATPQHSHSSGSTPTISVTPRLSHQRRWVKLWPVPAVLVAAGATFWLTKTVLSPQPASQTADRNSVPAVSPTGNPDEKPALPSPTSSAAASPTTSSTDEKPTPPSPSSSAAASPIASPSDEKPTSPSPNSSPVASPTASPAQKSTPPSPVSPPVATQPSPAPVPPAVKSPPPRKEPPVAELMSQADRLRESGQYQKAIAAYDQVIAANSNVAQAHWGKCYSLNSLGRAVEGLAACDAAIAINPNYPEALWSKGAALQQQNPVEALKLYDQATALKPDFAEAWNNKGVTLVGLGRFSDAVDAFDKATALNPNLADAWANRGAALWELGRPKQAIASMDKALQIQPDNQAVINLRQQAREKMRR